MIPALQETMCPHALLAFETKPSAPAWADPGFEKRRAYVRTANDACNPAFLQNIWIEKSKAGVENNRVEDGPYAVCQRARSIGCTYDQVCQWLIGPVR